VIPPAPRPLSRVIVELGQTAGARVSLQELTEALTDRSFAALIILFAAPNLLPLPPGSSTFFGIPLILIASQLLLGRPRLWLPRLLRERSLDQATFARLTTKMEPMLQRFERLAKPRYWPLPQVMAERFVGLVVLLMALVLVFPIPFGNWLPAFAISIIALAIVEKDGVAVLIGIVLGVIGLFIAGAVVIGLVHAFLLLLSALFS